MSLETLPTSPLQVGASTSALTATLKPYIYQSSELVVNVNASAAASLLVSESTSDLAGVGNAPGGQAIFLNYAPAVDVLADEYGPICIDSNLWVSGAHSINIATQANFYTAVVTTGNVGTMIVVRLDRLDVANGATIGTEIGLFIDDRIHGTNNYAIKSGKGVVSFGDRLEIVEMPYASRPTSPAKGALVNFTDALSPVVGQPVSAGGSAHILARWNGAQWTVVGV